MISVIVQIDRSAATPVRAQIAESYARAIRFGELAPGVALPSVRALSARLGVSPVTIVSAYRELCAAGLAVAVPRSGYRVGGVVTPSDNRRHIFQLNRIEPDLRIHPVVECARLMAELASDPGIGGYADYRGEPGLREAVAGLDRELGIESEPEQGLLITSGAQQALSLLGRALPPGSVVAVEDPCYPGARLAFSGAGATLVPFPTGNDGPEESALSVLAEPGRIAAFYCCPTYANPTGRSWSAVARRRVMQAAQRGGCLLIEDDYLGDLDDPRDAPPRLAALAKRYPGVRVVRIHTFSKTLLPALRLASVAGTPELIVRLLSLKVADDLGCSAFLQRALARLIASGEYQRHLARVRPRYRQTREAMCQAIKGIGEGIVFDAIPAGFCLLGRLDRAIDCGRFIAECARREVLLTPGADYWADAAQGADRFRIGFGSLAPEEVASVFSVLEEAAASVRHAQGNWSLL